MVSTCAATSWEQTKVDLEAHGTKRAEGIERLVKDKSAGITTLVTHKLDATGDKLDATGPKVRDAIVALVKSELRDMRSEVAVSWSSIVQAVRRMQQGLDDLDGSQRDMRSEVAVSWSSIIQSVRQMKADVGLSWGTITQSVRQLEKSLADADVNGPELRDKMEAIVEKVEAMQTAQSEMKTDVGLSWSTITQAVRQMQQGLAQSDQGSEVRAEMKAIADKVGAMKTEVGVSWGTITQAVRQMQQGLADSDSGELQTKLEAIAEKVEAMRTAQSEMRTDVVVSWGTITQAVRGMEKSLADSDNGELQTKLAAIADKIEAVQTAQIEMRTDVGVSWSSIMQAVRAMEKSLAESDHGPELQAVRELQESLAASQRGAEEKLSALAALDTVASKVETMTEANETMRTELGVSWATIVQSVRQMRQSLSENMSSRGKPPHAAVGPRADDVGGDDQTAKLSRETLDAVAEVKATLDALAAKKGDDPRTLTEETLDAIAATVKRVVGTRVSSTSTAPPGPRITADIAPAASQMLPTAMDNPFFDDDSNNNNKQALVIDDDTRKMLSDDLRRELDAKLGNVLEEIKRFLDEAAAAAPQPPAPGPSKLEIAMEQKLEHVAQMFQELQLSKLERDQRQRSAKLLSTFLWRKMREKLRVETFYETLIEYEGDPTTETRTKVERQFESIFKISNTIPTHGRDGRPLEQSERMRMWYNSRVGMVRQIPRPTAPFRWT
jgi:ketosteroid isomerase-like protein